MTKGQVSDLRAELLRQYPGANIKIALDEAEMVAEIDGKHAVAVIERSVPHFHSRTTEWYRGLKGVLYVACGGKGHVLRPGESVTIEPGMIHFARAVGEPAWIEVLSEPDWTLEDYRAL